MKNAGKILVMLGILSLLLAACGGPDYTLYGTWREAETGFTLEFRQDGLLNMTSQGVKVANTFEFAGPNILRLKSPGADGAEQVLDLPYSILKDQLVISPEDQPRVFMRLK